MTPLSNVPLTQACLGPFSFAGTLALTTARGGEHRGMVSNGRESLGHTQIEKKEGKKLCVSDESEMQDTGKRWKGGHAPVTTMFPALSAILDRVCLVWRVCAAWGMWGGAEK
jgi:uncharacterized membrane protein